MQYICFIQWAPLRAAKDLNRMNHVLMDGLEAAVGDLCRLSRVSIVVDLRYAANSVHAQLCLM